MNDFSYGRISFKRRFSLDLPLSSYNLTTLDKVLSVSTKYVFYNAGCTDLHCEVHILYRDESYKPQFLKLDLHDYTFTVDFIGDASICF